MELKDIIEAGLKKTSEKLDAAIATFEGQVKENGKAATEAKDAVQKLGE